MLFGGFLAQMQEFMGTMGLGTTSDVLPAGERASGRQAGAARSAWQAWQ
jgi:hypothetical protein